jgi:hypothetical protein
LDGDDPGEGGGDDDDDARRRRLRRSPSNRKEDGGTRILLADDRTVPVLRGWNDDVVATVARSSERAASLILERFSFGGGGVSRSITLSK